MHSIWRSVAKLCPAEPHSSMTLASRHLILFKGFFGIKIIYFQSCSITAAWAGHAWCKRQDCQAGIQISGFLIHACCCIQVYDGSKSNWRESDPCDPVNAYGQTKREAELLIQVYRLPKQHPCIPLLLGKVSHGTNWQSLAQHAMQLPWPILKHQANVLFPCQQ